MGYMSQLTRKTKEELAGELQGVIFRVPGQLEKDGTPHYVTAPRVTDRDCFVSISRESCKSRRLRFAGECGLGIRNR